jgi:DedD protein
MSDLSDANLQLKKRARRRLVGAVAFAGLAAVILPMVMDDEPKQQVQDVQILIPSQDQTPFQPRLEPSGDEAPEGSDEPASEVWGEGPDGKPAPKPVERPPERPAPKPTPKPVEKPPEKPTPKPAEKQTDAQRAAAILSGKTVDAPANANGGTPFVILIGAFQNPANVKILQTKIGELGIKVYTEPLESPGGVKKTRVRAGPFANRAAAEKALEKMKRIGVNGEVAAKQ